MAGSAASQKRVRKTTMSTRLGPDEVAYVRTDAEQGGVKPAEVLRRIVSAHYAARGLSSGDGGRPRT
jgi:hypothetical protein